MVVPGLNSVVSRSFYKWHLFLTKFLCVFLKFIAVIERWRQRDATVEVQDGSDPGRFNHSNV